MFTSGGICDCLHYLGSAVTSGHWESMKETDSRFLLFFPADGAVASNTVDALPRLTPPSDSVTPPIYDTD